MIGNLLRWILGVRCAACFCGLTKPQWKAARLAARALAEALGYRLDGAPAEVAPYMIQRPLMCEVGQVWRDVEGTDVTVDEVRAKDGGGLGYTPGTGQRFIDPTSAYWTFVRGPAEVPPPNATYERHDRSARATATRALASLLTFSDREGYTLNIDGSRCNPEQDAESRGHNRHRFEALMRALLAFKAAP